MRYVLLVLLSAFLLACDTSAEQRTPTPQTARTVAARATVDPLIAAREGFFDSLGGEFATARKAHGDTRLWNIGLDTCERLDGTSDIESELRWMTGAGFDVGNAGQLLGAAIRHICPQHTDAAQEWVDSH